MVMMRMRMMRRAYYTNNDEGDVGDDDDNIGDEDDNVGVDGDVY